LKLQPVPIPPELATLWSSVEHLAGAQFNSLLMNHYRDGSDCVGWHADNEKLYGPNPTIASLSFGQPREFIMRCNAAPDFQLGFNLGQGDMLVMAG
ncbi:DNA repair, partial [Haematococcus lacustris]